jgi:hypothetical protein
MIYRLQFYIIVPVNVTVDVEADEYEVKEVEIDGDLLDLVENDDNGTSLEEALEDATDGSS